MTLPDHLEAVLGELEGGSTFTEEGAEPSMTVARFPGQPWSGAATYTTLGLSKVLLHDRDGRHVRQELLSTQEDEWKPYEAASILAQTAERAVSMGLALPHGQVLGPAGPVVDGSELEAFVTTSPGYFADELAVFDDPEHDIPVVLAMLAPISVDEARFVREHGVDAFEDLLEAENPNLLDWRRAPFLRWIAAGESCPDCGQVEGHFHLPDGRRADPQ